MASISIKNVGPLTDTGNIDLSRFNVIIGKQSTGKSSFMKILCFCQWLEKKIMTGDDKEIIYNYTHYSRFLKVLSLYHRLPNEYFTPQSEIHYHGEAINIELLGNKNVRIGRTPNFGEIRHNTKLSFIPSERNLTSVIKNVDRTYRSNDFDVLFNHIFEWSDAKEHYSEEQPANLNIVGNMEYYYDSKRGVDVIRLKDKRMKISPFYASSGVQSILPIIVMINYYTDHIFLERANLSKNDVTEWFRRLSSMDETLGAEKIQKLYRYQNTHLFIEEPEQNLFPESQQALINHIATCINQASQRTGKPSSVVLTTHSPYIITAFNVLLKAAIAQEKDSEATNEIVPQDSIIPISDVRAYYITEQGKMRNIIDNEINTIGGMDLDHASDIVDNKLTLLNDVIYG